MLAERDPAAAATVHANDRRRVVRALELTEGGASLASPRPRLWTADTRHPTLVFGLELPKEVLARRIERRAAEMFERGVRDEVQAAVARPLSRTARQVIGLREVLELAPAEAIPQLVVRTRQYAAYQRKWMRRIPGLISIDADRPPGEVADEILEVARARQHVPARRAG